MNADQLGGLIRAFMAMFGGWALYHGFSDQTWLALTGGIVAGITALWSWYSHSLTSQITSVAESPEVTKVVVKSPSLSASIPSLKVVAGNK